MISTELFHWDKVAKTFSAEISDLGGGDLFEKVSPDSNDKGILLYNPRTGNEVMFVLGGEDRNSEGELRCWLLLPKSQDVNKFPGLKDCKMILFND
ncbi:hypothetical protein C4577_02850 [Candidatus Parcubacteria bacterium]|nr:MAG: hypothetical protein C4577_02850 [Candidatus Parcubacteria bacterium]